MTDIEEKLRKTRLIVAVIVAVMLLFAGLFFIASQSAPDDAEPQQIATIQSTVQPTTIARLLDVHLENPGFEGGFREYQEVHELKVANAWIPWWDPTSTRPEYRDGAPFPNRIRSGNHSQQWFNTYAVHTAGIYQRVEDIPPGTIRLTCYVQAFTSGQNNFDKSDGRYRMRIGVDPYGGIDPDSIDVVWSDGGHAIQPYDEWFPLQIETVVRSDRATIFVWGQPEWPLHHNNAYVDDCSLMVLSESPPTQPPPETPVVTDIDYERIRSIIRQELDQTRLGH